MSVESGGASRFAASLLSSLNSHKTRLQTLCRPVGHTLSKSVSSLCYADSMDTKLDDWFTKTQAAGFLKVSEKTVERLATKGTVRRATRKRPGVRPSPVYCPDDLERVKAAQTAQMIVMPPQEADPGELAVPASRAGELSVFLQSLITAATVPLRDKLFLNIKEAARFAGLPKATIRRLIHAAKNPRRQSGRMANQAIRPGTTRFETLCRPVRQACLNR